MAKIAIIAWYDMIKELEAAEDDGKISKVIAMQFNSITTDPGIEPVLVVKKQVDQGSPTQQ